MFIEDYMAFVWCHYDNGEPKDPKIFSIEEVPSQMRAKEFKRIEIFRGPEKRLCSIYPEGKHFVIYYRGGTLTSRAKSVKRLCEIALENFDRMEKVYLETR